MINITDLRSNGILTETAAAEIVALLVSIVDATDDPPNDLCIDALRGMRSRCENSLLECTLDWWLMVRLGERSSGAAFRLSELFAEPLHSLMESLRDYLAQPGATTLEGLRHRRRFSAAIIEFESAIHHEHGKAGVQAAVRGDIAEHYLPVLEQLLAGEPPAPPNLAMADIHSIMRRNTMKNGSDLWRKTVREWQDLDGACERAMAFSREAAHGYSGPVPDRVPPPVDPNTDIGRAVAVMLRDLAEPAPDEFSVVCALGNEADASGPGDLEWLTLLLEPVAEDRRTEFQRLGGTLTRVRAARKEITRLERAGVDLEEARYHLDTGDLSSAEGAVQEAKLRRSSDDRKTALRSRAHHLLELSADVESAEDLARQIDFVMADIDDDALDDAVAKLENVEHELSEEMTARRTTHATTLLEELVSLGGSLTAELQSALEQSQDDPSFLTDDDLAALEDQVDQSRASLRNRVDLLIERGRLRLDLDPTALEDGARQEIDLALEVARRLFDEGRLPEADTAARRAIALIDKSAEITWTAEAGEHALIDHIRSYAQCRMHFKDTDLDRLYVGFKTKRFVILSGLTGSGKTTIARLFAESVGATSQNNRFVRVAVRPNWVDEAEVLGYVNPTNHRFEPGWLATLMRECHRQPDLPFFCLLDEMNLAPVEYYLADYLSAIEDANSGAEATNIALYPPGASPENGDEWLPTIELPDNLFLIGTVNVDESTRPLSDRVLDRANVIQLSTAIGDRHHNRDARAEEVPRWKVRMRDWRAVCSTDLHDGHHELLTEIADVLNDTLRIGLGIRAHIEIERFLANAISVLDPINALDLALLQRVIPKIRGFKRDLEEGLQQLLTIFESVGAERCAAVADDWLGETISDDTFLDGTHTRVGLVTGRLA